MKSEPAIHLLDLCQTRVKCAALQEGKEDRADIEFVEPYLHFKFDFKAKEEELRLLIEIPVAEKHENAISVSKKDLELFLTQTDSVFEKYLFIGKPYYF